VQTTKSDLIDHIILEYVKRKHQDIPYGLEIHYVNTYRNHLAEDFGVDLRDDDYIISPKNEVNDENLEACKKKSGP
jgi:hypothetical protein